MKFGICDIRKRDRKSPKDYVDSFYTNNTREEIVLIGHSPDGTHIFGLGPDDVLPLKTEYLIWIYACLCGTSLCQFISKKGFICIGHIRKIIAFQGITPLEIQYIEDNIPSVRGHSPRDIQAEFKLKLYECAKNAIKSRDFAFATLLNYNRTSLKVF